jgi:hypothetical protein
LEYELSSARDYYPRKYSEYISKNLGLESKIRQLENELVSKEKAIIEASFLLKKYEVRLGAPGKAADPKSSKYYLIFTHYCIRNRQSIGK